MGETSTNEKVTLKPADHLGEVFEVIGGRDAPNKFDLNTPQVALQVKGGRVLYVSGKSGIAKGLRNGKLKPSVATPLRVTAAMSYGTKGPYAAWTLAPRNGSA
jgi:hypothetical protein